MSLLMDVMTAPQRKRTCRKCAHVRYTDSTCFNCGAEASDGDELECDGIENRIKALVMRTAERSARGRAMYEGKASTFVNVQTSVDDYDGEDDRDTDPPPPMSAVSCYWCGKKATVEIYHGIPSCGECHDRALRGKRR